MLPFTLGPFIPDSRFPALSLTAQSSLSTACPPWPWRACNLPCRAGDRLLFLQLTISYPLSSFPHATSQTLLAKFKQQHEDNRYFLGTPVMEPAFIIQHFAGKVKYQIKVCVRPGGRKGITGVTWKPLPCGTWSIHPLCRLCWERC